MAQQIQDLGAAVRGVMLEVVVAERRGFVLYVTQMRIQPQRQPQDHQRLQSQVVIVFINGPVTGQLHSRDCVWRILQN